MRAFNLQGAALDYAVAKVMQDDTIGVYFNENGRPMRDMARHGYEFDSWEPSTNWAIGGPIIERQSISICDLENGEWRAQLDSKGCGPYCRHYGPTPLIAAMRCYVASKMGNTVDIPEELPSA